MGYTHYWRREKVLDAILFRAASDDCRRVADFLGVPLAGPLGKGSPEFTGEVVALNGVERCGHKEDSRVGIAWPAKGAAGLSRDGEVAVAGSWFAGATLATRCCDGDCSHESFLVDRTHNPYDRERPYGDGLWFSFCKTAFKPYDLVVQCCLIAFATRFGAGFRVSSDGDEEAWNEARSVCAAVLGYGADFRLPTVDE